MGAIGTRLSLRLLLKNRANEMQSSGDSCREYAKLRPHPPLSSPGLCAIAHMDRATQYAAAHRLNHNRL
jgi:hypothetical protein